MKLSLVASTVFIATGLAEFYRVYLEEPYNWVASPDLHARKTCEDLKAPYPDYTAESWGDHVLQVCQSTNCGCTTALSFSIPAFDGPHEREWVGEMFAGPSTSENDYIREGPIEDSVAYTWYEDNE